MKWEYMKLETGNWKLGWHPQGDRIRRFGIRSSKITCINISRSTFGRVSPRRKILPFESISTFPIWVPTGDSPVSSFQFPVSDISVARSWKHP